MKVTLSRRFGGREGKVLSVIIGLALALSLSLLEYRLGFSIRSFGPIAAGILLFLVGMVIFYLVKSVGAGGISSGSIAFVVTYFLIMAALLFVLGAFLIHSYLPKITDYNTVPVTSEDISVLESSTWNFGIVKEGKIVEHIFIFKN